MALFPIGAYELRWFMKDQHVDAGEAVRIMLDTLAKRALGIHWGTIQLTDEARDAPRDLLRVALNERGIELVRFRTGSAVVLGYGVSRLAAVARCRETSASSFLASVAWDPDAPTRPTKLPRASNPKGSQR